MEAETTSAAAYAQPYGARSLPGVLSGLRESAVGVFAVCLGCAVLLRYYGLFPSVIDWDESLYAVMAQQWLQGELPYQAVWDQHSVGLPALFAAILHFFPRSVVAIRLSGCVAVAVAATAIYFTALLIDRRRLSGIVAVILYLGWTARWWGLPANTEIFLDALIAPAMYILLKESQSPAAGPWFMAWFCLASLLLGTALHIKHVAVAETVLFFGFVIVRIWKSRGPAGWTALAGIGGCFLLPTAVVVGYFYSAGLIGAYFRAVVDANLAYVAGRPGLSEIWPHLPKSFALPIGIVLVGAGTLWRRPVRLPLIVLGWAVAAGIDVALPGQFWPHYFLLLMPPAALLGGHLAVRFAEDYVPSLSALALPAALLLANPVGIFNDTLKAHAFSRRDVPQIIADFIDQRLAPSESIFVFNYQPVLYLLTAADVPMRHVFPDDWSRKFRRTTGVDPVAELEVVFANHPEFVVLLDKDWNHVGERTFALLHDRLHASYTKQFEITDRQILREPVAVQVYRRKPDALLSGED